MKTTDMSVIKSFRNERRELEVDVAKKLSALLVKYYGGYIKRLMMQILSQIEATAEIMGASRMNSILRGQQSYMMWNECKAKPSLAGLKRVSCYLHSGGARWLCVCSDLIRLFGELSESHALVNEPWGPPSAHKKWTKILADKDKLRKEPVYAKPAVYKKKGPEVIKRNPEGWGHRDRYNKATTAIVDQPFVDIPRERVKCRGVEKFGFGADSVIETIDWTYGLHIEGADVSGTTTDSISVLHWAAVESGWSKVNTVAQLIAIATMVPQGHHTIVECAWPLTRHGYMDYKIGFYDTLVNKKEHEPIHNALATMNSDKRNKHILVCRKNDKDWGVHFDTSSDKEEYRKIAGVRQAYSFCVGGRPRLEGIKNFLIANKAKISIPASV